MIEKGLSKEEMDFVTEALSIGAGNAATALSQMLGCGVELSAPKVYFLSPEEVPSVFKERSLRAIVAKMGFVGDMKGDIFYTVKEGDVTDLVHMIEKTFPVDERAGIPEISVIEETANIITGVYLSAISNFCWLNVSQTIPVVSSTTLQALIDEIEAKAYQAKKMQLIAVTNELTVAERRIVTYLLLAFSEEALKILSLKITEARRILEIKELEEKVVQRTLEFHTVVETAGDAIVSVNPSGEIYLWNSKAEETFGYSADEAIGKDIHGLITPERYREKAREVHRTFSLTGTGPPVGKTIEIEALRKDGTEFPAELTVSAMNIRGEWHASWIVRDITERKILDEKLRDSEEKFRSIFTEGRDGIVLTDAETGFIVECNPEFERQTGRKVEELRGMKIWETRPPEKVEAAREKFHEIAAAGIGGSSELELCRPGGDIVPIEFLSKKVIIAGKKYLQSFSRDITERRKAEEKLTRHVEELERFKKATIQRELRMREIKEENEMLKKRVEEMEGKIK